MSTFKTALRMALAHPFYLLIYTVFISLMGVFIAASVSWNSSQLTEYKPYDTNVIVVDRDNSDLSRALTKHLGSRFDLVTGVGDDAYDLADALAKSNSAKGSADCVFFIPEGFEDDLVAAARAGEALPKLDVTYGSGTMAAVLSSAEASRWISLAGAAAALEPAASNGDVARAAEHAAAKRAEVQIEQVKVDSTAATTLESYFNFGAYAIISSVIVSVGLVFSGMNEPERVRRMDASPVSERQRSLAVFAAAAVLTVCIWLVSSMMGVVGFAGAVAEVGVGRVCLALAATFALACTPLAVGFTLSSLGAREGRTQWRHTHVLNDPVHPVEVMPGSLLERALGGHRLIQTNSAHHCCVDRLGKHTRLVAQATDGVPECIEVEGQPFCLGVQWHPEYTWQTLETDFNLWKSFVEAAAKVKQAR